MSLIAYLTFKEDELMKLLPNITIRVPPVAGPVVGNTSFTTGGGGAGKGERKSGVEP